MARLKLGGILAIAAIGSTLAIASVGFATGMKYDVPVNITTSGGTTTVSGSLGSTRNNPDGGGSIEYIGCVVTITSGLALPPGQSDIPCIVCGARKVGLNPVQCTSIDTGMVKGVETINGDSFVQFDIANGQCMNLQVQNGSHFAPKIP